MLEQLDPVHDIQYFIMINIIARRDMLLALALIVPIGAVGMGLEALFAQRLPDIETLIKNMTLYVILSLVVMCI